MAVGACVWIEGRRFVCACVVLCLALHLSAISRQHWYAYKATYLFTDTAKSGVCAWILLPKEEYIEDDKAEDEDNGPGSPASHF